MAWKGEFAGKKNWLFNSLREAYDLRKEIYQAKEYEFLSPRKDPYIIDAGAGPGEVTAYFREQYPNSKILAIEPNPNSFALLKENIATSKFKDVTAVNAALGVQKGEIYIPDMQPNPIWGNTLILFFGEEFKKQIPNSCRVPVISLGELLDKPVDLVKMDIEGEEVEVLKGVGNKLRNVEQMIVEYHGPNKSGGNNYADLVALLEEHGFSFEVYRKSLLDRYFGGKGVVADAQSLQVTKRSLFLVYARRKMRI